MCGIVGSIYNGNAIEPVIEGLGRLEYRGYDSTGISYKNDHKISLLKKEGKLQNLKNIVNELAPESKIAIGHTRWATHGGVNDLNAHPHANESFSIVHNGIIENGYEIKEELLNEGYKFLSETDSEVFLVLLTKYKKELGSNREAISKAFSMLEGNSAVVIIAADENKIYAVKKSAPLVCGTTQKNKNLHLSSDPYALIGFAENLFFPEDKVLCELNENGELLFFELDGIASNRYQKETRSGAMSISDKGEFAHFMLKEIYEQPSLIKGISAFYQSAEGSEKLKKLKNLKPQTIHIIGCGTAWHAGLVIKNFIEQNIRIKVNVELASEFRYKNPIIEKDDIAFFISQSGETADTIACVELCLEKNIPLYSIVNVKGSTLYRLCEENFLIHAGQEIGVASTKAFTLQVLTGLIVGLSFKEDKAAFKLAGELELFSTRVEELLKETKEIKEIAQKIYNHKGFLFTGRNSYYPIAFEGALKLKEIAYVHAEGYASGELKHGPIALIDEDMVNIAICGPELFDKTFSNIEEVKARRGIIVSVGPKDDLKLARISDYYIGLNLERLEFTKPILINVVMQLLSYYIAREKGTDIDKPRNLAKSVTVE